MKYIKLGWVKPVVIQNLKGITVAALKKKKERGQLIENVHWRKADDNVIYYHFENINKFQGGEK